MSSPVPLCRLLNGFSVALALDVQLVALVLKEPEDRDFPRSELTFLVLLVAVLLQSDQQTQRVKGQSQGQTGGQTDWKDVYLSFQTV